MYLKKGGKKERRKEGRKGEREEGRGEGGFPNEINE